MVIVGMNVLVGVAVGTGMSVSVGLMVAVGIILPPSVLITNWGGLAPSRLERLVAVLLAVSITKSYWPMPVTIPVTLTCDHVLAVIGPELLIPAPKAGALLKVISVSPHAVVVV